MFSKSITILVAVWCLQVCLATKLITDYSTCIANYNQAICTFKAFWAKFERTRQESRNKALQVIDAALAKRVLPSECLKAFPNQTAEFYNYRMFKTCGGISEDMDLYKFQILDTKEETCGRLVTYSSELLALDKNNKKARKRCNFLKVFEEHFGKSLDACLGAKLNLSNILLRRLSEELKLY